VAYKRGRGLEEALREALRDDAKGLEIDAWSETILLLMDDAPHSRLGGHKAKAAGGGTSGLDAAVASRGAQLLLICVRDEEGDEHHARRSSVTHEAPAPPSAHDDGIDKYTDIGKPPTTRRGQRTSDGGADLAGLPCDLPAEPSAGMGEERADV
jgi:hypothetical protein